MAPGAASAFVVAEGLGPFDDPFDAVPPQAMPPSVYLSDRDFLQRSSDAFPAQYPLATYSSGMAAPWILASGREVLPIGGVLGGTPAPTLQQLRQDIASDRVRAFMIPLAPYNDDPRILWILHHCRRFGEPAAGDPLKIALYDCSP